MSLRPFAIVKVKLMIKDVTVQKVFNINSFIQKNFEILFKQIKVNIRILILYYVFDYGIKGLDLVVI